MKIVPLRPEHTEDLLALYRTQVVDSPHSRFIPEAARFWDELTGNVSLPPTLFAPMLKSQIFVAEGTGGRVEGFVALVKYIGWDDVEHEALTNLCFTNEEA